YTFPVPANVLPGMPAGTFTGSASDYANISGVRKWEILVAPFQSGPGFADLGQRHGILRNSSQSPGNSLSANQMSIRSVTDGLSNTFMIQELAGRPDFYNAARQLTGPAGGNSGAGWGDGFNGESWPGGTTLDGNFTG